MKVLHLIDAGTPETGPCTRRLAAASADCLGDRRHDGLLVGGPPRVAAEPHAGPGLRLRGSLGAPRRFPPLAARGLRAFLRGRGAAGGWDVVHAWSLSAGALAAAGARGVPVVVSVVDDPAGRRPGPLLRFAARRVSRGAAAVLPASEAVRASCAALGVHTDRLEVTPPGVDPAALRVERRAVREAWGVEDSAFVVGLLVEPVPLGHAWAAGDAVGRLALTGRNSRVVVPAEPADRPGAAAWLRPLALARIVIVDDAITRPWRVAAGLDAALVVTAGRPGQGRAAAARGAVRPVPGVLPALWAMAAGVPVVAEDSPVTREIAEGCAGPLLAPGDVNGAAQHLLRLATDRSRAAEIGAAGRALVERRFSLPAFAGRLAEVYGSVVSRSASC